MLPGILPLTLTVEDFQKLTTNSFTAKPGDSLHIFITDENIQEILAILDKSDVPTKYIKHITFSFNVTDTKAQQKVVGHLLKNPLSQSLQFEFHDNRWVTADLAKEFVNAFKDTTSNLCINFSRNIPLPLEILAILADGVLSTNELNFKVIINCIQQHTYDRHIFNQFLQAMHKHRNFMVRVNSIPAINIKMHYSLVRNILVGLFPDYVDLIHLFIELSYIRENLGAANVYTSIAERIKLYAEKAQNPEEKTEMVNRISVFTNNVIQRIEITCGKESSLYSFGKRYFANIKYLLGDQANLGEFGLTLACEMSDIKLVDHLLSLQYKKPKLHLSLNRVNTDVGPTIAAIYSYNPKMLRAIIKRGASITERDRYGFGPKYHAIKLDNWLMYCTIKEIESAMDIKEEEQEKEDHLIDVAVREGSVNAFHQLLLTNKFQPTKSIFTQEINLTNAEGLIQKIVHHMERGTITSISHADISLAIGLLIVRGYKGKNILSLISDNSELIHQGLEPILHQALLYCLNEKIIAKHIKKLISFMNKHHISINIKDNAMKSAILSATPNALAEVALINQDVFSNITPGFNLIEYVAKSVRENLFELLRQGKDVRYYRAMVQQRVRLQSIGEFVRSIKLTDENCELMRQLYQNENDGGAGLQLECVSLITLAFIDTIHKGSGKQRYISSSAVNNLLEMLAILLKVLSDRNVLRVAFNRDDENVNKILLRMQEITKNEDYQRIVAMIDRIQVASFTAPYEKIYFASCDGFHLPAILASSSQTVWTWELANHKLIVTKKDEIDQLIQTIKELLQLDEPITFEYRPTEPAYLLIEGSEAANEFFQLMKREYNSLLKQYQTKLTIQSKAKRLSIEVNVNKQTIRQALMRVYKALKKKVQVSEALTESKSAVNIVLKDHDKEIWEKAILAGFGCKDDVQITWEINQQHHNVMHIILPPINQYWKVRKPDDKHENMLTTFVNSETLTQLKTRLNIFAATNSQASILEEHSNKIVIKLNTTTPTGFPDGFKVLADNASVRHTWIKLFTTLIPLKRYDAVWMIKGAHEALVIPLPPVGKVWEFYNTETKSSHLAMVDVQLLQQLIQEVVKNYAHKANVKMGDDCLIITPEKLESFTQINKKPRTHAFIFNKAHEQTKEDKKPISQELSLNNPLQLEDFNKLFDYLTNDIPSRPPFNFKEVKLTTVSLVASVSLLNDTKKKKKNRKKSKKSKKSDFITLTMTNANRSFRSLKNDYQMRNLLEILVTMINKHIERSVDDKNKLPIKIYYDKTGNIDYLSLNKKVFNNKNWMNKHSKP